MTKECETMHSSFNHASQQPYSSMDTHKSMPQMCSELTSSSPSTAADQVLQLAEVTSAGSHSNLVFIANAINYLDSLTSSLNKQNSLVKNLQQMIPAAVAPGNESADSTHSGLSQAMSPGPMNADQVASPQSFQDTNVLLKRSNASVAESLPLNEGTHLQSGSKETYQPLHFEGDLHGTVNGGVSRKQRYQRTHDVLKQSGLLDIARKTSILLKQSAQLDKQIATFKAIVNDHCRKIMTESESHRLLAPVNVKATGNITQQPGVHSEINNKCP